MLPDEVDEPRGERLDLTRRERIGFSHRPVE
jgi:hypothetical protein